MAFWRRFRLRLTFLNSLLLILSCEALANARLLNLADTLFNTQDYEEAITEYKRFIFFHPEDNEGKSYAYYKIGLSFRANHKWREAIDALRTSIQATDNGYLRDERRITLATTLIAKGDYSLAQLELLKVSCFSKDRNLQLKALYFQGIAYLYTFNWEGAQEVFREVYSDSDGKEEVDHLLKEAQHLPYKSAKVAKVLSTILPGSGQIYAGDLKNGLNAFLLNGLTTTLLLREVFKEDYLNASLVFLFLFGRYYRGNRYWAEKAALEYNQRLNCRQAEKILQILLKENP